VKTRVKIIFKKDSFVKEEINQFDKVLTSREQGVSKLPSEIKGIVDGLEGGDDDKIEETMQMLRKAYKLFKPNSMEFS